MLVIAPVSAPCTNLAYLAAQLSQLLGLSPNHVATPSSKMPAKSNEYEEQIEAKVQRSELKTGKGLQNRLVECHLLLPIRGLAVRSVRIASYRDK
jgi:hypothetical protein